jgi:lipopolysaccharide transport system permease protein
MSVNTSTKLSHSEDDTSLNDDSVISNRGSESVLILEPGRANKNYWADLWHYRELLFILGMRDVSVRYKQTIIGVAWAVLRPFITMLVFTLIFGRVARLPTEGGAPYALLVYVGMLPWYLFSTTLGDASNSLIVNSNLISKVYFPRLIVPASTLFPALIDFVVSFVILIGMMAWYQVVPGWQILALPFLIGLCLLTSLGPALWMTALNVKYRDFRYVIPFILQFGLYISPVGFSSNVIPESWRFVYSLNPMVGVIDAFRWSILGGDAPIYWPGFASTIVVTLFFLCLGFTMFRKMEHAFADLI